MITGVASTSLERDVARILAGIEPVSAASPALLVLAGLPATGKTHLAGELSRRTGAVVLESDAIRSLLFRERHYSGAENRRLFAAIHAAIDTLLARRASVIVDATNLAARERTPLYEITKRRGTRLIVAQLTAPDAIARARLDRRSASETSHSEADLAVYKRMRARIEEIRRPHHLIDTSEDIEPALGALTKEMMRS
jgi:predicted kinase